MRLLSTLHKWWRTPPKAAEPEKVLYLKNKALLKEVEVLQAQLDAVNKRIAKLQKDSAVHIASTAPQVNNNGFYTQWSIGTTAPISPAWSASVTWTDAGLPVQEPDAAKELFNDVMAGTGITYLGPMELRPKPETDEPNIDKTQRSVSSVPPMPQHKVWTYRRYQDYLKLAGDPFLVASQLRCTGCQGQLVRLKGFSPIMHGGVSWCVTCAISSGRLVIK